ncbi:hypothetical protein SAMN02745243_00586 [Hespellia stercorisuis DSM 15480]|uniref:DUF4238 domain-containing protein n=1 Tax=Hespellia stercorisuis DSM 15480 TaxID=1121950 RepID=A0A1M6J8K2_9FIRM|nr:hypothetical protein SAMN02745243_00586 [Hespellia stercorisuis DSM 15480]
MADTKKEHYVPRCYLENYVGENQRIKYLINLRCKKGNSVLWMLPWKITFMI